MYQDQDPRRGADIGFRTRMGRRGAVGLLIPPAVAIVAAGCRGGETEAQREFRAKDAAVRSFVRAFVTDNKREQLELTDYFGSWQLKPPDTYGGVIATIDPVYNQGIRDVSYIKMNGSLAEDFQRIAFGSFGNSDWRQLTRDQEYQALEAATRSFIALPPMLPVTRTIEEAEQHLTAAGIQVDGDLGRKHIDFRAISQGRFNLTVSGYGKK